MFFLLCVETVIISRHASFRCKTCGEYIYKGKKFNARKETVQNELYLGLPIFRFYIKCTRCLAEITFKVIFFRGQTCSAYFRLLFLCSLAYSWS